MTAAMSTPGARVVSHAGGVCSRTLIKHRVRVRDAPQLSPGLLFRLSRTTTVVKKKKKTQPRV